VVLSELLSRLSNKQIAELILEISDLPTGEKHMWGWVKSLFSPPFDRLTEVAYQMTGMC
jgi:hypothetical protein